MKALGHGNFCTSIPVAPLGARNWYIFNFTVKTFTVNRQELVARDSDSAESAEIAGILFVFPNFSTERMGQKTRHKPQTIYSEVP